MSLLFFDQQEDGALIVTDTLVTVGDNVPVMFQSKVWQLPHLNMVMVLTGTANVGTAWYQAITTSYGLYDIESVNKITPDALNAIYAAMTTDFGHLGSTTIYQFGFPEGYDKLVSYAYRSSESFKPERFAGSRFCVKPMPPEYQYAMPANQDDIVALAHEVRDFNSQILGEGGVAIGGELYATFVENGRIQTARCHRFADYDETRKAMCSPAGYVT